MSVSTSRPISKRLPILLILLGVLILAAVLLSVLNRNSAINGNPQLVTDLQEINFGDVKMGEYVQADFRLTNSGTAPLKIVAEPYIEVREGC